MLPVRDNGHMETNELVEIVKKGNEEECEGFIVVLRKDSNFYHTHLVAVNGKIYQELNLSDVKEIDIVPKGELPF